MPLKQCDLPGHFHESKCPGQNQNTQTSMKLPRPCQGVVLVDPQQDGVGHRHLELCMGLLGNLHGIERAVLHGLRVSTTSRWPKLTQDTHLTSPGNFYSGLGILIWAWVFSSKKMPRPCQMTIFAAKQVSGSRGVLKMFKFRHYASPPGPHHRI